MKEIKAISLLKKLKKNDIESLKKFINSPYHVDREKTKKLFDAMLSLYPSYEYDETKKGKLYLKMMGKTFSKDEAQRKKEDKVYRNECSDLLEKLYEFIGIEALNKNRRLKNILILEELSKKGLKTSYKSIDKKLKKDLEKGPLVDGDFYSTQLKLEETRLDYSIKNEKKVNNQHRQNAINAIDSDFLTKKLKYACSILDSNFREGVSFDFILMKEILNVIDWIGVQNFDEIIQIYYKLFILHSQYKEELDCLVTSRKTIFSTEKLSEKEEESIYYSLKETILKNFNLLSPEEQENTCILTINYAQLKYRSKGKDYRKYMKESFEIYKILLNEGILFTGNQIPLIHYINLIKLSIKANDTKFAKKFVEDFKDKVNCHKDDIKSPYHLNKGEIAFTIEYNHTINDPHYIADYSKVWAHLREIKKHMNHDSKSKIYILELKTYYESNDHIGFDQVCNKFGSFLTNSLKSKKTSLERVKTYRDFINISSMLLKLKFHGRKITKSQLKKINSCPFLIEREWLEDKIEEVR